MEIVKGFGRHLRLKVGRESLPGKFHFKRHKSSQASHTHTNEKWLHKGKQGSWELWRNLHQKISKFLEAKKKKPENQKTCHRRRAAAAHARGKGSEEKGRRFLPCWSAVCVHGKSKGNYNDNWHIILNSWLPVEAKSFRLFRVNSHFPIGKWKMRNSEEKLQNSRGRGRERVRDWERKKNCRVFPLRWGKKLLRWGKKVTLTAKIAIWTEKGLRRNV